MRTQQTSEQIRELYVKRSERGAHRGADEILAQVRSGGSSLGDEDWLTPVATLESGRNRRTGTLLFTAAAVTVLIGGVAAVTAITAGTEQVVAEPASGDDSVAPPNNDVPPSSDMPPSSDVPPSNGAGSEFLSFRPADGYPIPRIALDRPGFSFETGYVSSYPRSSIESNPVWVARNPETLVGPSFTLLETSDRWQLDEGETVTVGSSAGLATAAGALQAVQWTTDREWLLIGVDVDRQTLLDVAASLELVDGQPTLPALGPEVGPIDLVDATQDVGTGDDITAEFSYRAGDVAGDLRITSATRSSFEMQLVEQVGNAERLEAVDVGGHPAVLVDKGDDTYRSALWTADGFMFELRMDPGDGGLDDLRLVAESVTVADDETWARVRPNEWVEPSELAGLVADIVADITLPDEMTAATLTAEAGPNIRYATVSQVTGSIACAWIDQWTEARTVGDQGAADEAAAALADARQWDALVELADEGGWSDVLWQYADAVNGDGTVVGSRVLTVEESYQDALGC